MTTTHSITEDIFFSLDMRMILLFYQRHQGDKGFRRHDSLAFQGTQNDFQVERLQVECSGNAFGLSVVGQTEQVTCLGEDKTFNLTTPKLRVKAKEALCCSLLIVCQCQYCARLLDAGHPDKSHTLGA